VLWKVKCCVETPDGFLWWQPEQPGSGVWNSFSRALQHWHRWRLLVLFSSAAASGVLGHLARNQPGFRLESVGWLLRCLAALLGSLKQFFTSSPYTWTSVCGGESEGSCGSTRAKGASAGLSPALGEFAFSSLRAVWLKVDVSKLRALILLRRSTSFGPAKRTESCRVGRGARRRCCSTACSVMPADGVIVCASVSLSGEPSTYLTASWGLRQWCFWQAWKALGAGCCGGPQRLALALNGDGRTLPSWARPRASPAFAWFLGWLRRCGGPEWLLAGFGRGSRVVRGEPGCEAGTGRAVRPACAWAAACSAGPRLFALCSPL